jgi:hypothetical protein
VSVANDTGELVQVIDRNLEEVMGTERAVLILAKEGCGSLGDALPDTKE